MKWLRSKGVGTQSLTYLCETIGQLVPHTHILTCSLTQTQYTHALTDTDAEF